MDNAGNAVVAYQTDHFGGTGGFAILFDIEAQRLSSSGANIGFTRSRSAGLTIPR